MHFCDKTLTGCSSSRALAHILGRPVLEQSKANVRFCVPIRKEDDDRYEQFKTAQKVLNKQVMTKEAQLSSSKSRQTVLDLTSLGKRTVTGQSSQKHLTLPLQTSFTRTLCHSTLQIHQA